MIEALEKERDLSRTIVHIDLDAFYASVEILSRPHLKDVPMAVGSNHMLVRWSMLLEWDCVFLIYINLC